jgi:hypothetical protein
LYEDDGVSLNIPFHVTTLVSVSEPAAFAVRIESSGDIGAIPQNQKIVLVLHNISGDATLRLENCGLENRTVRDAALNLTIAIGGYPANVRVSRDAKLVLRRVSLPVDEVPTLLRRSRIGGQLKKKLLAAIRGSDGSTEAFVQAISQEVAVPSNFKEVLYGELADIGAYHFTKDMGQNVFVVWNSKGMPSFTYASDFFRAKATPSHQRESGIVPQSLIYRIDEYKTLHEVDHIRDYATRKMRLSLRIMNLPAFPFNFDDA